MAQLQTRRNFVRAVPLAAGVLLPLTGLTAEGQTPAMGPAAPFQVFPGKTIEEMAGGFMATPGSKDIAGGKGLAITMTVSAEANKRGKEFEYHATRDHVFQVLDGMTVYHLGGTPKNARETKPGEWLAPESEGFTTITLQKGDYLTIPRMTPHKRLTDGKVSLLLISANSPA